MRQVSELSEPSNHNPLRMKLPSKMNRYTNIAEYYDAENERLEILRRDVPFFLKHNPARRPLTILELATGTARAAIPIAQAGHTVVGIERDPAMLAIARSASVMPSATDRPSTQAGSRRCAGSCQTREPKVRPHLHLLQHIARVHDASASSIACSRAIARKHLKAIWPILARHFSARSRDAGAERHSKKLDPASSISTCRNSIAPRRAEPHRRPPRHEPAMDRSIVHPAIRPGSTAKGG